MWPSGDLGAFLMLPSKNLLKPTSQPSVLNVLVKSKNPYTRVCAYAYISLLSLLHNYTHTIVINYLGHLGHLA
jgi:hypothetical protein